MVQNILRRTAVEKVTGLGRTSIYRLMGEGKFPKCIKVGPRAVGWLENEVSAWQAAQIAERDAALQAA